ncbi:MAG: hypothetical protein ACJAQU_001589 [Loktanella salsilacus]
MEIVIVLASLRKHEPNPSYTKDRTLSFDAPFVEPTTFDEVSAAQLLTKIDARNPDKRIIHVIWDHAAYHKGPDVRALLARAAWRIHLIQLPQYCPHLNLIERL